MIARAILATLAAVTGALAAVIGLPYSPALIAASVASTAGYVTCKEQHRG